MRSTLAGKTRDLLLRAEFGDALLVFYFIVLIRPWFWGLENFAAWCLTIPLALIGWYFYISTKEPATERLSLPFWLIVALPLMFVYALRAPFPDVSFDVWSLRLFHGERALRGFLYHPGEFFPTAAPFNPAPDMLTGIFRNLLGYRLGTLINYLVLVWAGTVIDKLLRPHIRRQWLRAAGVLLVLCAEHMLFEINNYMVDLLALPLMLEATRVIVDEGSREKAKRYFVRVAFLIGASVTLKLSNAAVAAPLVAVCVWRALSQRPLRIKELTTDALGSVAVVVTPLIPFTVWLYKLTGSPVFPIYNGLFQSPFYPPFNGWDDRWGGYGAFEILAWPVLMFFHPHRIAELGVYSGRISVGFVLALLCLLLWSRVDARTRTFAFVIIVGSLLWSLTMGYIRYGLYLEVLSGILMLMLASQLINRTARAPRWRMALAVVICAVMVAQSALASFYVSRQEWSMRPTAFQDFRDFTSESRYLLRDRSIRELLSEQDREMFDGVEVWVVSGAKTAGLMPMLNDRAPFVGVRSLGLFLAAPTREEFARALNRFEGKRMYSLALPQDFEATLSTLRSVGLQAGPITNVEIPLFAPSNVVEFYFFEVTRASPDREPPKTVAIRLRKVLGSTLRKTPVSQCTRAAASPWLSRPTTKRVTSARLSPKCLTMSIML
ncbi:MAG TPA: hypothetical protein VHD88_08490 [Pyrinomonadaceae bacterium]|nr:hypothetical protein [Pyrinomonadaceae bacterium]